MPLPIIALDIDDTLYEHFCLLAAWHNATYGTALELEDNHPFSPRHWGTPALQAATLARWHADSVPQAVGRVHEFFDTPAFRQSRPFADAPRVLAELATSYTLVAVTARDVFMEAFTRGWLERHFAGLVSDVILTARYNLEGKSRDKVTIMRELGASMVIDDDIDVCVRAASHGLYPIVFGDYPWNSGELPVGVRRAPDWLAVKTIIEDEYAKG